MRRTVTPHYFRWSHPGQVPPQHAEGPGPGTSQDPEAQGIGLETLTPKIENSLARFILPQSGQLTFFWADKTKSSN